MRYLIAAALVLSCSLCMAEDFPEDKNEIKSLTAEQADELIFFVTYVRKDLILDLHGLTSIDKDVAQELAKIKRSLALNGLTSIDEDVAQELAKFEGEKFTSVLALIGLTSIDEVSLAYLKSNKSILLPEKYRNQKD